jgi:hypothetical protein
MYTYEFMDIWWRKVTRLLASMDGYATGELQRFSQECINYSEALDAFFNGRRATTPTSVVSFGLFRQATNGHV